MITILSFNKYVFKGWQAKDDDVYFNLLSVRKLSQKRRILNIILGPSTNIELDFGRLATVGAYYE